MTRSVLLGPLLFASGLSVLGGPALPAQAEETPDTVVTVGKYRVSAAELAERLRGLPLPQLRGFGTTPTEIRRNYVHRVLVPELLYVQEARERRLGDRPKVKSRELVLLQDSITNEARRRLTAPGAITEAELQTYYDANRSQFETPERIQIWRILVDSEAEARQLLDALKKDGTSENWSRLTRERSKDASTKMRRGNLGFVMPDGKTNMPRLVVDPGLFAAAQRAKDGDILQTPVPEGKRFAVLWRRSSLPAVHRALGQEAGMIRQVIVRQKLVAEMDALLDQLQASHVRALHPELLEHVKVSQAATPAGATPSPVAPPAQLPEGSPEPSSGDRGLR